MKAFLLAAGRGTRISRFVEKIPKSTLPIDGVPLIKLTAEMLIKSGIEVIVCVGYRYENVYKALDGVPVKYFHNPFFEVTNSIASLWFAKEELNDDSLIINADVFFQKDVLNLVNDCNHDAVMLIDKTKVHSGDYFLKTTVTGEIEKYGKDLPLEERSAEYIGIAKISKDFVGIFSKQLDSLIKNEQYDLWWENVLYSYVESKERDIATIDVDGRFWSEIDYWDDYERILKFIEGRVRDE